MMLPRPVGEECMRRLHNPDVTHTPRPDQMEPNLPLMVCEIDPACHQAAGRCDDGESVVCVHFIDTGF